MMREEIVFSSSAPKPSRNTKRVMRLLMRDGPQCWLCDGMTNAANRSIDHVIPKAKGGQDTLENLKLAHRWCNSRRGKEDAAHHPIMKREEGFRQLKELLKTMDVPQLRTTDIHWLRRNLGIRNHENPDYQTTIDIIRFLCETEV